MVYRYGASSPRSWHLGNRGRWLTALKQFWAIYFFFSFIFSLKITKLVILLIGRVLPAKAKPCVWMMGPQKEIYCNLHCTTNRKHKKILVEIWNYQIFQHWNCCHWHWLPRDSEKKSPGMVNFLIAEHRVLFWSDLRDSGGDSYILRPPWLLCFTCSQRSQLLRYFGCSAISGVS